MSPKKPARGRPGIPMGLYLDRAHDLQAPYIAGMPGQAARFMRTLVLGVPQRARGSRRSGIAEATMVLAAIAIIGSGAMSPIEVQAQETASRMDPPLNHDDGSVLAELGLNIANLEATDNLELLWRAVREVVLPGKVTEATQRRILRRVWAIDPDVAKSAWPADENH